MLYLVQNTVYHNTRNLNYMSSYKCIFTVIVREKHIFAWCLHRLYSLPQNAVYEYWMKAKLYFFYTVFNKWDCIR